MSLHVQTLNSLEQQQDWQALEWASEEMKGDKEILLAAYQQMGLTFTPEDKTNIFQTIWWISSTKVLTSQSSQISFRMRGVVRGVSWGVFDANMK